MGLLEEKIPRNPTRTYNQTTNESMDPSQNKRDTAAGGNDSIHLQQNLSHSQCQYDHLGYYQGAPPH
jgi:hypothetical protein